MIKLEKLVDFKELKKENMKKGHELVLVSTKTLRRYLRMG